jgi:hypothetical protein
MRQALYSLEQEGTSWFVPALYLCQPDYRQFTLIEGDPMPPQERENISISYSHKDKKWLEKLQTMLAPLVRKGMIKTWADTNLKICRFNFLDLDILTYPEYTRTEFQVSYFIWRVSKCPS